MIILFGVILYYLAHKQDYLKGLKYQIRYI